MDASEVVHVVHYHFISGAIRGAILLLFEHQDSPRTDRLFSHERTWIPDRQHGSGVFWTRARIGQ